MSLGFTPEDEDTTQSKPGSPPLRLAPIKADSPVPKEAVLAAVKAGQGQGFVSRQAQADAPRRKPGPRRTEPQDKLMLTGPKRVLDLLREKADAMGGVPYWQALEALLDRNS
ncbi:MAG: hypothetical protein ACOH2M_15325 [Cypionkella sp.]